MDLSRLRRFARFARRNLIEQVGIKLEYTLSANSSLRREYPKPVKLLEFQINEFGKDELVERVAYIWFNRFCALRFMDVNRYTSVGIISPDEGQTLPAILTQAKRGYVDAKLVRDGIRQRILDLLNDKYPSRDAQGEAYRLLFVAACNWWHSTMPFLFQCIDDYTELLLPEDLLSGDSILAYTREAMFPGSCKNVEVVGWLYQFYISEKKDQVFEGLRKNQKVTPENIPAATQLFTPHWIVQYLVENSLGRLWMLNNPDSTLIKRMKYYIESDDQEVDFLRVNSPEEIKVCDPACGSGHMLTYAFDLLYAIYEEEGYDPASISEKIIANNLYGIEIDDRAGGLAAFALAMKARSKQTNFFERKVESHICVLENIRFEDHELDEYLEKVDRKIISDDVFRTARQFEEAKNFGALIHPIETKLGEAINSLKSRDMPNELICGAVDQKVTKALVQADFLATKYHVVVANPPYMGSKKMNLRLKLWTRKNYPISSSDLYAAFIERGLELAQPRGYIAMVTMQSWMFLLSFCDFRESMFVKASIHSMMYMSNMVMGIAFGTSATVWKNFTNPNQVGKYCFVDVADLNSDGEPHIFPPENEKNYPFRNQGWFARASTDEFKMIPGSPVAYWVSKKIRNLFRNSRRLADVAAPKQGSSTGDNDRFLRLWHEVSWNRIGFGCSSRESAKASRKRWFPYHKGGPYRKWHGNQYYVIDWENDGERIRNFVDKNGKLRSAPRNLDYNFKRAVTYTALTNGAFNCRLTKEGYVFDAKGPLVLPNDDKFHFCVAGLLNSRITNRLLNILTPTMDYGQGSMSNLPWPNRIEDSHELIDETVRRLREVSKFDWDSHETSFNFIKNPLLTTGISVSNSNNRMDLNLAEAYCKRRELWRGMVDEMTLLEKKNNQIFIDQYDVDDEFESDVPLHEITLTCNPHYRYGSDRSEDELETLLRADTIREFVSYAVGCMFGRYSLDKPGLILANQGETAADYSRQIPNASFPISETNVIPLLDENWFADDMVERFREFVRTAFGIQHYGANIQFIENALNIKNKHNYSIRDYFLREFYSDHVKRYKKRPIYWLFSSPSGNFNALIYMHRYRTDTCSIVLNDYLREFREKLRARKNQLQSISMNAGTAARERNQAIKEIEKTSNIIRELEDFETYQMRPLATEQKEIDLDDGVKANYRKFGRALKKVAGLSK